MDSSEDQLLYLLGELILSDVAGLVALTVSYGLYLAVFTLSMRALMQRRPITTQTIVILILLWLLFVIAAINFSATLAYLVILVQSSLLENAGLPLEDRLDLGAQRSVVVAILSNWVSTWGLPTVIADSVVVWRACILWPYNKLIRISLSALVVITFGFSIATGVLNTRTQLQSTSDFVTNLANDMYIVLISSSLCTNIAATLMIGIKAYKHRQVIESSVGLRKSKAMVILSFLTESGIVFCILQALFLGLQLTSGPTINALNYVDNIYLNIFFSISAAYPSLIFLIVHHHKSIADHTGIDSSFTHDDSSGKDSFDAGTHISFALNPGSQSETRGYSSSQNTISQLRPGADRVERNASGFRVEDVEKAGISSAHIVDKVV